MSENGFNSVVRELLAQLEGEARAGDASGLSGART